MTPLEETLIRSVETLERLSLPYMVIGGLANAVWGLPRATIDVDITLQADDREIPKVVASFQTCGFRVLASDPSAFVQQTRVLPIQSPFGVRVDLIWATLPFEENAIRRAVSREVAGRQIRFTTAEDLILHKIVSKRERDQTDVKGVITAQGVGLDRGYLDERVRALSEALEEPDIWIRYQKTVSGKG